MGGNFFATDVSHLILMLTSNSSKTKKSFDCLVDSYSWGNRTLVIAMPMAFHGCSVTQAYTVILLNSLSYDGSKLANCLGENLHGVQMCYTNRKSKNYVAA